MWLHTVCEFSFDIPEPTPFVLMLRPRSGASQWVSREEYRLEPSVSVFEFTGFEFVSGFGFFCFNVLVFLEAETASGVFALIPVAFSSSESTISITSLTGFFFFGNIMPNSPGSSVTLIFFIF